VDLTVELAAPVTVETVNNTMRQAAAGALHGILQYQEEPIVSTDIIGNSHSSIFDPALTQVMEETFVKVIAWYDNEWGYSARVEELIGRLAGFDGMTSDFRR
jgi:glyceraldehyde 3-phosphate dehydrogenase